MNEQLMNEFVDSFTSIFEMEDSELEQAKSFLINEIAKSLSGPEVEQQLNAYLRQCDLAGYTLEDYAEDIENSKNLIYTMFMELKQQHPDSPVKQEILDMVYGLIENYFNLVAIRISARDNVFIGIEKVHPNAVLPTYAHEGDQGADIYAVEDVTIEPHTYGNMVPTGLKMMIPQGWAISIRPRSGMSKNTPLRISNSPATIDQQYRGEVKILFDNFSNEPVTIKTGERIAQFILEKNYRGDYNEVETVEPTTERGEGGFGSSGN